MVSKGARGKQEEVEAGRSLSSFSGLQFSCPEVYNGTRFGYPFYATGFTRLKCVKSGINYSTSIIIDRPQSNGQQLKDMVKYAQRVFNTVILVMDMQKTQEFKKLSLSKLITDNIKIVTITNGYDLGSSLNKATALAESPYVLIAPFLTNLDSSVDIERLIHVSEVSGAALVGSSMKNFETGEWERGCYQSSLNLYILKYTSGYHKSQFGCLYCSYTPGVVLGSRRFFKENPFNVYSNGVYRDLFLRMKSKRQKLIVCPDIMFYTNTPSSNENDFVQLTQAWDVGRIIEPDGRTFSYSCRTEKMRECYYTPHTAVPLCCRVILANSVKFVHQQCVENNIEYEFQDGTLLGAVKLENILPWEKDADITILSNDFEKFKKLQGRFTAYGFKVKMGSDTTFDAENGVMGGGSMKLLIGGWKVEIWGAHILSPSKHPSNARTKIRFSGTWVYAPENPGQFSRNRYGKEIYHHAEHWMVNGKESSFDLYDPGSFQKCAKPGHHGCLDKFLGDGSKQFEEYL